MESNALITGVLLVKAGAIALLAFLGMQFALQARRQVGLFGALFTFGIAAYQVCSLTPFVPFLHPFRYIFLVGCFGAPVFLWVFSRALFDDDFRPGPVHLLVFLGMEAYSFARYLGWINELLSFAPELAGAIHDLFPQLFSLVFVALAVHAALRGREADLIEGRRGLRTGLVIIIGVQSLLVLVTEIYLKARGEAGGPNVILEIVNSSVILLLTGGFGLLVLHMSEELLRPSPALRITEKGRVTAVPAAGRAGNLPDPLYDPEAETIVARLSERMDAGVLYREEGLTIRGLADHLSVPEYRLRRIINGRLGYRNFNEYLNQYRVAEACAILSDPDKDEIPVLRIAMDLGYGSLATFNRAFRNQTNKTPTQFRSDSRATAAASSVSSASSA